MSKLENQKKAKKLSALLVALVVPVYFYSGFQRFSVQHNKAIVDWCGIFVFLFAALIIYPILHRINVYSQLGEMKYLSIISKFLFLLLRGIFILAPFAFFLTYIMF